MSPESPRLRADEESTPSVSPVLQAHVGPKLPERGLKRGNPNARSPEGLLLAQNEEESDLGWALHGLLRTVAAHC